MSALLVLCTCPDAANAQALADSLVERRLAACVNLLPGVRSVYRWQGRVEQADEVLLLVKTTDDRFEALQEQIVRMHPYAVPEVLAFKAVDGLPAYLGWVETETRDEAGA
ncbi:MAG: divalent-cation tolerance protein CutA [Proteobacteria bacterium]|nr:divalent-cation tolerance protein CutA [Pseudomonadota bacterium]